MTNKFLFSIIIASVIVMAGSIAYVNYENHVQTSGYPDYHVNVHIPTAVDNYPIELSGVPSGSGFYQQLITINNPSQYGINTAGSNVQFTAQNGTLLYAWEQSINTTTLTVWVKNFNGSATINMEVFPDPEFENLFSANGYLRYNGTLIPTNATLYETLPNNNLINADNPVTVSLNIQSNVQNINQNFFEAGTTGTNFNAFELGIAYGGHTAPSGTTGQGIYFTNWANDIYFLSPVNLTNGQFHSVSFTLNDRNVSMWIDGIPVMTAWIFDGSTTTEVTGTNVFELPNTPTIDGQPIWVGHARVSITGYGTPYLTGNISNVNIFSHSVRSMPTFTIGTGSVFQANATADNYNINIAYNHQNITVPSGNWYNVSLKAYSNYSYSFYYNDSPMYFNYSGLINNTFYTGFLDRNVTISLNFVGSTYSGTTSLVVLEKGE